MTHKQIPHKHRGTQEVTSREEKGTENLRVGGGMRGQTGK